MRILARRFVVTSALAAGALCALGAGLTWLGHTPYPARLLRWTMEQNGWSWPVIVLSPGTEVLLGNTRVPVYGVGPCPRSEGLVAVMAGDWHEPTTQGCIRLEGDHVLVLYPHQGALQRELWSIVHGGPDGHGISLRRPNGEIAIPVHGKQDVPVWR